MPKGEELVAFHMCCSDGADVETGQKEKLQPRLLDYMKVTRHIRINENCIQ